MKAFSLLEVQSLKLDDTMRKDYFNVLRSRNVSADIKPRTVVNALSTTGAYLHTLVTSEASKRTRVFLIINTIT